MTSSFIIFQEIRNALYSAVVNKRTHQIKKSAIRAAALCHTDGYRPEDFAAGFDVYEHTRIAIDQAIDEAKGAIDDANEIIFHKCLEAAGGAEE